jgi:hypothetical protein
MRGDVRVRKYDAMPAPVRASRKQTDVGFMHGWSSRRIIHLTARHAISRRAPERPILGRAVSLGEQPAPKPDFSGSRPDCRVGCLDTWIGPKFIQAGLFVQIEQASVRVVLIDVTVVIRSPHLG